MLEGLFHLIFALSSTYIGFGRRYYPQYHLSYATLNMKFTFTLGGDSSLVALHLVICTTLNGYMYYSQSFPGFAFSFKCFVDNTTSSPGPMSDFLLALLACNLLASTYFVSHLQTVVHVLYNANKKSPMVGIYVYCTMIFIIKCNLCPYTIS